MKNNKQKQAEPITHEDIRQLVIGIMRLARKNNSELEYKAILNAMREQIETELNQA